jgi:hypothetical protein
MPSQEEISNQQGLLAAHRRTLAHLLRQQASLSQLYTPPGVPEGIRDARNNIERIKRGLRHWGVFVEDLPDDEPMGDEETVWLTDVAKRLKLETPATRPLGSVPQLPALIIGREDDLRLLKAHLGMGLSSRRDALMRAAISLLKARLAMGFSDQQRTPMQRVIAICGWPGVGKTTIAAALAHDPKVAAVFPDGILWSSLGQQPKLDSKLATWGVALGVDDIERCRTVEEMSARLAALLRDKRMLLIVDDVWEAEHISPFMVGGYGCATLITTRDTKIAATVAPTPDHIYRLAVLSNEKALKLLKELAPSVVAQNRAQCLDLVQELEGLPLALQVAGRLLNIETIRGFSVTDLLIELRTNLLKYTAPLDRTDLATQTTPTVAALLRTSTDRLDPQVRDCFAILGPFAPKPATFDLIAMRAVWKVEDPKPIARELVDRGLLEPVSPERFQMHSLLVLHAKSLLTET